MSEPADPERPALRIGTAERNAALAALDSHLEAGRLDAMEYGERSAKVAEARTVDDLDPLFVDLPAPHPEPVGRLAGTSAPVPLAAPGPPAGTATTGMEVWGPRVAAVTPFVAVALFLLVGGPYSWLFFLMIPAAGVLFAGSRDGHPGRPDDRGRRDRRRDERHE